MHRSVYTVLMLETGKVHACQGQIWSPAEV